MDSQSRSRSQTANKKSRPRPSQPSFECNKKCIVVTGGGSGIGAALCRAFVVEGASHVVIADIHYEKAKGVAAQLRHLSKEHGATNSITKLTPIKCNVTSERDVEELVKYVEDTLNEPIDLFVANAGIYRSEMIVSAKDGKQQQEWKIPSWKEWNETMSVNFHQQLHVVKHVLPRFQKRGGGHLLFTSSAAGLLIHPDSLSYTVSKSAVISLAEWIATTVAVAQDYKIGVSLLCPQGVDTPLLHQAFDDAKSSSQQTVLPDPSKHLATLDGILQPDEVADVVIRSLKEGTFLILPHKIVQKYVAGKAMDRDKWIAGTRYLVEKSWKSQSSTMSSTVVAPRSKL